MTSLGVRWPERVDIPENKASKQATSQLKYGNLMEKEEKIEKKKKFMRERERERERERGEREKVENPPK